MARITIEEQERMGMIVRRAAPVITPMPGKTMREMDSSYEPVTIPPQPIRSTSHLEGSYSDRARGFSIATWQMSSVTAVSTVVLSQLAWGYPILSLTTLAWLVTGYLLVWFVSFTLHTVVSPEGADILNTVFMWRYLRREQNERHRRYWQRQEGA